MSKKKAAAQPRKRKPRARKPQSGAHAAAVKARDREGRAVELRLAGKTLNEIAIEVGYADRSSARLAVLRGMERLSPPAKLEQLREREVAKTYEVEHEAWEQWYRSTEDAVRETVKRSRVDAGDEDEELADGVETETTRTVEGQSGNPGLLDKILKAMERRAKLLGIDAPEKVDFNAATEVRVIGQNPADVLERAARRARGEKVDAVGE